LSADQIYQFSISTLKPRCCIVNTDESWKPGKHWVVFYWCNNNNVEFFNNYGPDLSEYSSLSEAKIEQIVCNTQYNTARFHGAMAGN